MLLQVLVLHRSSTSGQLQGVSLPIRLYVSGIGLTLVIGRSVTSVRPNSWIG